MTPDQQFIIQVLTLFIPVITGAILFWQQQQVKKAADLAAEQSKKAETAANHSKDEVLAVRKDFQAAIQVLSPTVGATTPMPVNIVNSEPVPVVVAPSGIETKGTTDG